MARMCLPLGQAGGYSAIIDARSEDEFALDHLPDAVNWPSLNNEQRIVIGTLYKQTGPFEAKKKGAGLVAANIARHIEQHVIDLPKDWQPLVYCWRGGQRSGSFASILSQIGWRVEIVAGGYKTYRTLVVQALYDRPFPAPVPSPRKKPRRKRTASAASSCAAETMSPVSSTHQDPARCAECASPA